MLHLASQDVVRERPGPESGGGHSGHERVRDLPDGLCHAVSNSATYTLCGIAVDDLHDWPTHSWSVGVVERCGECSGAAARYHG